MQLRSHNFRPGAEYQDLCTCNGGEEIETDCFAGGGGAGYGFMLALGRTPRVAVNHDNEALAMYEANHPGAEIHCEDIRDVDPRVVARCPKCRGMRVVGAAWFSPDCKEHSNAKNGALQRDKEIRMLPHQIVTWARVLRPRVIFVENVEEMLKWGPLDRHNRVIKRRQGEDWAFWWQTMMHLGYKGEFFILRACDYGAPTTRKRLYCVFRCDGLPIEKPTPTHASPEYIAAHPDCGLQPYRTAAECIDFGRPCPSIFMTKAEAKAYQAAHQLADPPKRPLAEKTLKRIARGLRKYVLEAKRPFIVPVSHGDKPGDLPRVHDLMQPVRTVTGAHRGELAYVQPYLAGVGGRMGCSPERPVDKPYHTITSKADTVLVAPTMVQTGYGERPGQEPRCLNLHQPLGTVVSCAQRHALVLAFLAKHFGDRATGGFAGGAAMDKSFGAVTCRDHHSLVTTNLVKFRGTSDAHHGTADIEQPLDTVSAGGIHAGVTSTFLTRYNSDGCDGRGQATDCPLSTIDTANRIGEVRAFLTRYNGQSVGQPADEPVGTIETHDRYGVVQVDGVDYQIADIGMRMLTARELARAQGLPDSWVLDPWTTKTVWRGRNKKRRQVTIRYQLSTKAQVRMVGNMVCPDVAAALVRANYTPQRYAVEQPIAA